MAAAGPREAGAAASLVSRPAYPGEYDWLAVEWPELAAFLATHDLAARPIADEAGALSPGA